MIQWTWKASTEWAPRNAADRETTNQEKWGPIRTKDITGTKMGQIWRIPVKNNLSILSTCNLIQLFASVELCDNERNGVISSVTNVSLLKIINESQCTLVIQLDGNVPGTLIQPYTLKYIRRLISDLDRIGVRVHNS